MLVEAERVTRAGRDAVSAHQVGTGALGGGRTRWARGGGQEEESDRRASDHLFHAPPNETWAGRARGRSPFMTFRHSGGGLLYAA
ncbi:hypothetical protein Kpho02_75900 [Kitasatospora phosalacinea]|uniref:Uncharacterized protein n=1 Tax=Kitasatospora phosalacinea TaxID=2065 RepID=A0A9W6QI84_9ACTN|nr:hypothetical protein Kpho02_75900 [Kitasatospora phosalacinea]